MRYIKRFKNYKLNETIFPEDFIHYKDDECEAKFQSMDDFQIALAIYNGSFNPDEKPWGNLICVNDVKYLLTEYGSYGNDKDYMIFTNIEDQDDYFTVNYNPVTSNAGKKTKPFKFYNIE